MFQDTLSNKKLALHSRQEVKRVLFQDHHISILSFKFSKVCQAFDLNVKILGWLEILSQIQGIAALSNGFHVGCQRLVVLGKELGLWLTDVGLYISRQD